MGGAERLARQRAGGRLDARAARSSSCSTRARSCELGTLVGSVHRGVIAAGPGRRARRRARPDRRSAGARRRRGLHRDGRLDRASARPRKRQRLAELAGQERVPLVHAARGRGGADAERVRAARRARPNDLQTLARVSGARARRCAWSWVRRPGHGALTAPLMDFVVMVEGAALFSAGPPLVQAATGEEVDQGGARRHGGAHRRSAASRTTRRPTTPPRSSSYAATSSYFPSNAWQHPPPVATGAGDGPAPLDALLDVVPGRPAARLRRARRSSTCVADAGSVLEIQPAFGRARSSPRSPASAVRPSRVVANQPAVKAGAIDADAADKAAHFLDVADAFHLPVVFLADNPGVLAGTAAERSGDPAPRGADVRGAGTRCVARSCT